MTRWLALRPIAWLRETGQWPRRYLLYRRIHPLWLVLSRALPDICLDPLPHPERANRLPVRHSYAALYRRVIEVHDGLADMRVYADPSVADLAALGALAGGLDPTRAAAVGIGVRLQAALQAHAAGVPPKAQPRAATAVSSPAGTDMDVDEQARWLAHVASAYRRVCGYTPRPPRQRSARRPHRVSRAGPQTVQLPDPVPVCDTGSESIVSHRRRRVRALAAAVTALLFVTACQGSSLNDDEPSAGPLTIGVLWPQSGPYKAIGDDLAKGWQLYLDSHGGKLGNHAVTVRTADEGDGKQTAVNAAKRLIEQEHALVLAGTGSADTVESIQTLVTQKKVPLVGAGGRPSTLNDISYIWHTSWLSRETGQAIADHVRTTVDGPVYVIGPGYQGGYDQIGGFVDAFTAAGGRLANDGGKPTWTPWPTTTNFLPYLNKVAASGAKAVYSFYAGVPATEFVKQYAQAGLKNKVPLYGAAFLTEGAVLSVQGEAADGVQTVSNYAANLDNPANKGFVAAFTAAYGGTPNMYHVTGYDAAAVLDRAIAAAGANPTSQSINTAIGGVGELQSPRGSWRFGKQHSPIQPWYLREVRIEGGVRANIVVRELTTLGS